MLHSFLSTASDIRPLRFGALNVAVRSSAWITGCDIRRSRRPGSVPDRRLSGVSRRTVLHLELRRTANDKFRADFVTSSATDRRAVEIRTLSERDCSDDDSAALRALKELENSFHRSSPESLSPLINAQCSGRRIAAHKDAEAIVVGWSG